MKRLLVFVLLLALGFAVLRMSLGDERIASASGPRGTPVEPLRETAPAGRPIQVKDGTELQVGGGFTIAPKRSVPLDGGGTRFVPVYELTCDNCRPADGARHRLDKVAMKLFDQGEHVADLTASSAIVELQIDDQQRRSLRENREIELTDAVFTTVAARLAPMRLEVGHLRAVVDEGEIALHTPDENEPVRMTVDGDRAGTLTGKGMRARMPRGGKAELGRFDLLLLHEPTITLAGVDLTARGQLHYVEQLATGTALLTVEDSVHVDLAGMRTPAVRAPGDGAGGGKDLAATRAIDVRGDRLHGWLRRARREPAPASGTAPGAAAPATAQTGAMVWTMLRLLGSRARVQTGDIDLQSPRLTVVPGPTGAIAGITADGGPSELRQVAGGTATFRSPRPIHLQRTDAWLGEVHRSFGFPTWSLGPIRDLEVVSFDGAADVDAGEGVSVAASRGLHLFRQLSSVTNRFVARGFGDVVIARREGANVVEARGDHGFVLWRTERGDEIVLGRADPTADQRFTLTRGDLALSGNGAARLLRTGAGDVEVHVASDRPTIEARFDPTPGTGRDAERTGVVRGATSLDATMAGEIIRSLRAAGPAVECEFAQGKRRMRARTAVLEQIAANSWRLTGAADLPARLELPTDVRARGGALTAPTIDVHRVATRDLVVDANAAGDVPVRFAADQGANDTTAERAIATTARRIRLFPFAVGPAPLVDHVVGLPKGLAAIVAAGIRQPWLLATGAVTVDGSDQARGNLHGEGELLLASQGTGSLLLVGDPVSGRPATLHRTGGERDLLATGARVRVVTGAAERITVLTTFPGQSAQVPPCVVFRGAPSATGDGTGSIRGVCSGEIEVVPEAVLFHGPVTATSLRPDGTIDPEGMQITAHQMQMNRQRETGQLTSVVADEGVTVDWRELHATSRRIELDLRWQRCIAEDPDGAEIRFGARRFTAPRLEANYATWSVRYFDGRLVQEAEPDRRR